jgi:hypothetical protein
MGILFSISNLVRLPWRLLETWGILKKKRLTGGSEGIAIKPPINNKLKSLITPITLQPKLILIVEESSSPGEFHPQALTDPDVNVSAHPALIIQSLFLATSPYLLAPPITG